MPILTKENFAISENMISELNLDVSSIYRDPADLTIFHAETKDGKKILFNASLSIDDGKDFSKSYQESLQSKKKDANNVLEDFLPEHVQLNPTHFEKHGDVYITATIQNSIKEPETLEQFLQNWKHSFSEKMNIVKNISILINNLHNNQMSLLLETPSALKGIKIDANGNIVLNDSITSKLSTLDFKNQNQMQTNFEHIQAENNFLSHLVGNILPKLWHPSLTADSEYHGALNQCINTYLLEGCNPQNLPSRIIETIDQAQLIGENNVNNLGPSKKNNNKISLDEKNNIQLAKRVDLEYKDLISNDEEMKNSVKQKMHEFKNSNLIFDTTTASGKENGKIKLNSYATNCVILEKLNDDIDSLLMQKQNSEFDTLQQSRLNDLLVYKQYLLTSNSSINNSQSSSYKNFAETYMSEFSANNSNNSISKKFDDNAALIYERNVKKSPALEKHIKEKENVQNVSESSFAKRFAKIFNFDKFRNANKTIGQKPEHIAFIDNCIKESDSSIDEENAILNKEMLEDIDLRYAELLKQRTDNVNPLNTNSIPDFLLMNLAQQEVKSHSPFLEIDDIKKANRLSKITLMQMNLISNIYPNLETEEQKAAAVFGTRDIAARIVDGEIKNPLVVDEIGYEDKLNPIIKEEQARAQIQQENAKIIEEIFNEDKVHTITEAEKKDEVNPIIKAEIEQKRVERERENAEIIEQINLKTKFAFENLSIVQTKPDEFIPPFKVNNPISSIKQETVDIVNSNDLTIK